MSLKSNRPPFFGSALAGACLAVGVSVPITAWLGSLYGDTYNMRVAIYFGLLLWVIAGAVIIFLMTRESEKPLTVPGCLLWLVSTWLWPVPAAMWLMRAKRGG